MISSDKLLFEQAKKLGLNPQWETHYGFFSLKHNEKHAFIFYTNLTINNQLGYAICLDKYLARIVFDKYNLPNIPYCYSESNETVSNFINKHTKVIRKPLKGKLAEDVEIVTNLAEIETLNTLDYLFEKYTEGSEFRYLLLNGEIIAANKKIPAPTPQNKWTKKVNTLHPQEYNSTMIELTKQIAKILNMGLLAADFIQDPQGKIWILEVNSTPGISGFYDNNPRVGEEIARKILVAELKNQVNMQFIT